MLELTELAKPVERPCLCCNTLTHGHAGEAGSDLRRLADAVLEVESLQSMDEVANRAAEQTQKMAAAIDKDGAADGTAADFIAAASREQGVPDNVATARAWIAAWRSAAKLPVSA